MSRRRAFLGYLPCRLATGLITAWLAACSGATPTRPLETATLTQTLTVTATPSIPPTASSTLIPSDTPEPDISPRPSETSTPLPTPPPEEIALVILDGKEVGAILKSGDLLSYASFLGDQAAAVDDRAVLKLIDPQGSWRFNLQRTSGAGYTLKADPRHDYKAYGVLIVYQGKFEIEVRFIGTNFHSGEKLRGRVFVPVQGIAAPATETSPADIPGISPFIP